MKKLISIIKNIFSKISRFLIPVFTFLKQSKSLYLMVFIIIDLFLIWRSGSLPTKYAFYISLGCNCLFLIVNEIFRKHDFWPMFTESIITPPRIVGSLYFFYITPSNISKYHDHILVFLLFLMLEIAFSLEAIIRTNKGRIYINPESNRNGKQTASLLFIMFSGFVMLVELYVVYFTGWRVEYFYPVSTTMGFPLLIYVIAIILLLTTKNKILTLSFYRIFITFLYLVSCTLLVYDTKIPYFPENVAIIFISLYISNILFTLGCGFANEKKKIGQPIEETKES